MKHRKTLAVACLTLISAGCANNADVGRRAESSNRQQQPGDSNGTYYYGQSRGTGGSSGPGSFGDTAYRDTGSFRTNPGTGSGSGTGVGGGAMPDSGFNDSIGIYGPTGPMPGEKGTGGTVPPGPDTLWGDTLAPPDTAAWPDGRASRIPPGGLRSNQ